MAETSTAIDITEDMYDTAVAAVVDMLRSKYPDLDLRSGTAIRSLVVSPIASLMAAQRADLDKLRTSTSIAAMQEAGSVDYDAAAVVLSNFGISLGTGAQATGQVRVVTTYYGREIINAGTVFRTAGGVEFTATERVTVSTSPAADETQLVSRGDGTYYYTVPVIASEPGQSGNIPSGTALTTDAVVHGLVMLDAFSDFTGGAGSESFESAVARIPSSVAYRGLTNTFSTQAQLTSALSDTVDIRAVSCTGFGSRAQLRDKHNAFGVAVGGRVDVYVRIGDAPKTKTVIVDGTPTTDESGRRCYSMYIDDCPGFYGIRSVSRAEYDTQQGSLDYVLRRELASSVGDHDIDLSVDSNEVAWSVYQRGHLLVFDSEEAGTDTVRFKVELYYTPGIDVVQEYMDRDDVRNVAADYIVRSAPMCLVTVKATVRSRPGIDLDAATLASKVVDYINGRSFTGSLTRSEIANVLLQNGAASTDLGSGGMYLAGRLCGAGGEWESTIEGDILDVSAVGDTRSMLTSDTVVFAAEQSSVQITVLR